MDQLSRPTDRGTPPSAPVARLPRVLTAFLLPAFAAVTLLAGAATPVAAHSGYCGHEERVYYGGTGAFRWVKQIRFVSHRNVRHDSRTYHVHTYAHEEWSFDGDRWVLVHTYDTNC